MKSLVFTPDHLSSYYNERFIDDLEHFYQVQQEDDITLLGARQNNFHASPILLAVLPHDLSQGKRWLPQSAEEELYFIALLGYVFAAESSLLRHSGDADWTVPARLMNSLGLPWIVGIDRRELDDYVFKHHIYLKEEALALQEAINCVVPFMNGKLHPHVDDIADDIEKVIHLAVQETLLRFHTRRGLLGLDFSSAAVLHYYHEGFSRDFRKYFPRSTREDEYEKTLFIGYWPNKRPDDGMPGRNASESLLFAAILLYQYIAQQGVVLKGGAGLEPAFHQCSGWPMIYTGPGGGPYLHPLKMLEEAGLLPGKNECSLFLEAVHGVFPRLREDLNSILNGRFPGMKDKPASEVFLTTIRGRDRIKQAIIKHLDSEETCIPDLIDKWRTSPATRIQELLEENGIPLMAPM